MSKFVWVVAASATFFDGRTKIQPDHCRHNSQTSTMSSSYGGTHPSPSKDDQQPPIEQVPPPAFSQTYGHVDISQDGIDTNARIAGTCTIEVDTLLIANEFKMTDALTFTSIKSRDGYLSFSHQPYAVNSKLNMGKSKQPRKLILHCQALVD